MTTEEREEGVLLYKEGKVPQECAICGKKTKRLVNTTEFEAEAEWTAICGLECEAEFEDKVSGDACGDM